MRKIVFFLYLISISSFLFSQNYSAKIALIKYNGGGDWYSNPSSLKNLVLFCNENLQTNLAPDYATVDVGSPDIYNYPFVHLTGHGNVIFSAQEADNLRNYLIAGGFLHISDNYGLDEFIRREIKKVFPETEFVEVPFSHPIFHQKYSFKNGLPKIHEHDGKPPQAFGIFYEGRLVVLYDYECDLGDGWEDVQVHNDPETKHLEALQMGANIIQFVFTN